MLATTSLGKQNEGYKIQLNKSDELNNIHLVSPIERESPNLSLLNKSFPNFLLLMLQQSNMVIQENHLFQEMLKIFRGLCNGFYHTHHFQILMKLQGWHPKTHVFGFFTHGFLGFWLLLTGHLL